MPNSLVQSFAKKSGKSVPEVEKLWNKVQDMAKEKGLEDEHMYAYTVGILKKMLSIEEDFAIGVDGPAALDQGFPAPGNSGVFADKIGKIQKRKYSFKDYLKDKGV